MQQVLTIGAKHQVTIPKELLKRLGLEKGSQLLVELRGDQVVLHPAVSVPRRALPEALVSRFTERRGERADDVSMEDFLAELRNAAEPAAELSAPAVAVRRGARKVAAAR